jgi:maltose alpha-D-glucosyltransferase / alpha-amylase
MKQPGSASDPLWYKDAIVYELHVKCFYDSSIDGYGDFEGLRQKLDYIQSLGVTSVWLLPFYPSPLKDDGYDIADYEGIHPSYGTIRDFRNFLRDAHERGLQVITELVINHTSDQHPWFQAARKAPPDSSKRQYYVWSDTDQKYADVRVIFTDTEKSNWTWAPEAKAYYWHRFFHHQPDLNFDNPRVRRAVLKILRYWLNMGVDGLRLDAIPYLIEREGTNCENLPETHDVLKEIRREVDRHYENRMLLAEANQWPADVRPYFGDGDECHMAFHFPLMPRIFMSLKQEDRHPITEILRQTPEIPENCQWALFLRNHDELTLEMCTDEERDYMYQAYAADPQMRLNLGIRRRLAPLMEFSRPRIELLYSLLFSFPGTPVLYYGDEIGMGDNIYLGDRNGVRTPMQWTGDRNGGFSRADPARLYAPLNMDPVYGYQALNVEAQERSPFSLLNWTKRMIALRRQHKTFGRGTMEFLHPRNRKVLVYIRRYEGEVILCVANLSRTVQPVELDLAGFKGLIPIEMIGRTEFPRIGELPYFLTLAPYSFYWFQLQLQAAPITARTIQPSEEQVEPIPAFFAGVAWDTLLEGNVRTLIERESLRTSLQRQRWFAGKARAIRSARITDWVILARSPDPAFLTLVDVDYEDGGSDRYFLPLALRGGAVAEQAAKANPTAIVANVTGARKGILIDAVADEIAGRALLAAIEAGRELTTRRGATIRAFGTRAFEEIRGPEPTAGLKVSASTAEQSNTSIVYGDRFIMKLFRRLQPGPNPDLEIGRYLTEEVGFPRVPPLAGGIEYARQGETPMSLAMLQGLVTHQANGWEHALDELGRYYERADARRSAGEEIAHPADDVLAAAELAEVPAQVLWVIAGYLETAATLGRRTAELHLALARETGDPAFRPEPISGEDLRQLVSRMRMHWEQAFAVLEANFDRVPEEDARDARQVIAARDRLLARLEGIEEIEPGFLKTRVHGDYHLGQVLWSEGDFIILDFEGEPQRSLAERRAKQSPLKDVAGMLRSFSYAAYGGLFNCAMNMPDCFDPLEPWARLWQNWNSAMFLRGYRDVAGASPILPKEREQFVRLLELFLLDKALYELDYELNNRPAWLKIPLRGILAMLESGQPIPVSAEEHA